MLVNRVRAINGECPFDFLIHNVKLVNVYNNTINTTDIGIVNDRIAYVGTKRPYQSAITELDGKGRFAFPGLIDSHMHLESSMMTPAHFAETVLRMGTTTVVADPHEIVNVMGITGLEAMLEATKNLPLRVIVMAPSTIPSLPGFEDSGFAVGSEQMDKMLNLPGIGGLGEVMDFNGVAAGEENIIGVIESAANRGAILDGHASALTGDRLQAFRAVGIDSDHTVPTGEKLLEELALGFTVQVQESMLSEEMVKAMNEAPVSNRICLVTDDVPLPRLMNDGHLNHVASKAISLGLDPVKAVKYTTINPAERMRLYDLGGIAPGMIADIQLVDDLSDWKPSTVIVGGKCVYNEGRLLISAESYEFPAAMRDSMNIKKPSMEDFEISCEGIGAKMGDIAEVNIIHQNGISVRTEKAKASLPVIEKNGKLVLDTENYCKMAVFNRYGKAQHGISLVDGLDKFNGAVAITYGHDCHNLVVFGKDSRDMLAAAERVIDNKGGIVSAGEGEVKVQIPLPIAGLLSEEEPEDLLKMLTEFLDSCMAMGFEHERPMSFFTTMALAVSPEIKCTDKGLLDVINKRFIPLIENITEGSI